MTSYEVENTDEMNEEGSHLNSGYDSTDEERGLGMRSGLSADEEELILNKLREIVRKCTVADPMKRLTAPEVVKMLGNLNIGEF